MKAHAHNNATSVCMFGSAEGATELNVSQQFFVFK